MNDLLFGIEAPDIERSAAALARINWSRSDARWKDLVVEKEGVDGIKLVLRAAGASSKREMVSIIRKELGIDRLLTEAEVEAA